MRKGLIGDGSQYMPDIEAKYQQRLEGERLLREAAEIIAGNLQVNDENDRASAALLAERLQASVERQRALDSALASKRADAAEYMSTFLDLVKRAQQITKTVGSEDRRLLSMHQYKWTTSQPIVVGEQEGIVQAIKVVSATERTGRLARSASVVGYRSIFTDQRLSHPLETHGKPNLLWFNYKEGIFHSDDVAGSIAVIENVLDVAQEVISPAYAE